MAVQKVSLYVLRLKVELFVLIWRAHIDKYQIYFMSFSFSFNKVNRHLEVKKSQCSMLTSHHYHSGVLFFFFFFFFNN